MYHHLHMCHTPNCEFGTWVVCADYDIRVNYPHSVEPKAKISSEDMDLSLMSHCITRSPRVVSRGVLFLSKD